MSKVTRTPFAGTPEVPLRPDSQPQSFDPWKFGKVAISPSLRKELIGTELPVIPPDRLYASAGSELRPAPPAASEAERRGSFLAAAAVLLLFGFVMLGWSLLGRPSAADAEAPARGEPTP
jgi:hypothetical protein